MIEKKPSRLFASAALACGLNACAMEAATNDGDEEIAEQSAALNGVANFNFSVAEYKGSTIGNLAATPDLYTTALSVPGTSHSPLAQPNGKFTLPFDGLFFGLWRSPERAPILDWVDFRLTVQEFNSNGAASPIQKTGWASEGGGWSGFAEDVNDRRPDFYNVGIETRGWPGGITSRLKDMRIRAQGSVYTGGLFPNCSDPSVLGLQQGSAWLQSIAVGTTSFAAPVTGPGASRPQCVRIMLDVLLQ